jgi:hypothetical protein
VKSQHAGGHFSTPFGRHGDTLDVSTQATEAEETYLLLSAATVIHLPQMSEIVALQHWDSPLTTMPGVDKTNPKSKYHGSVQASQCHQL